MQNAQYSNPAVASRSHPVTPSSRGADNPVRRASDPPSIPTVPLTNHQRSHSQLWHPYYFAHGGTVPMMAPPGVNGLPTTHTPAPLHVSPSHTTYQEQIRAHQQHFFQYLDPHAQQHAIAHAQIPPAPAPAPPPLPSPHHTRPLEPAQLRAANPQQQFQQQQQQRMTHTPTTTNNMLNPARPSPIQTAEQCQSLAQLRAQPPAPTPPARTPMPIAMQLPAATRLRDKVEAQVSPGSAQTQNQQAAMAAVAGTRVDAASLSTNASASVGVAPNSGPGTQMTKGPPPPRNTLPMPHAYARSPVSGGRGQAALPPPAQSAPKSSPSSSSKQQQQQQQQHQQQQQQRFNLPPAVAAYKVLQPAKDLLEQTWAAAIAAVQREFTTVTAEFERSASEKKHFTELVQRLQGERLQALHALHNTQAELSQCMSSFQEERRMRVHLERTLAEMSHRLLEKCTCGGAAAQKSSPTTPTPPPLALLDHVPPAPLPSTPTSVTVPAPTTDARTPTPAPEPGPGSSPRTVTQSSSSPATDTVRSSVRRHEREGDDVEAESAPTKRRRIERTPTPKPISSSPSAPAPEEVVDTREASSSSAAAPVGKIPAAQPPKLQNPQEQPTPEAPPPPPQQLQEKPKTPPPAAEPRRKIGIQHIQLVYETVGNTLQCRMCLLRRREVDRHTHVVAFPFTAAYDDLVGHCEREHDAALEALAGMSPGEIAEMRQRLQAAAR